MIDRVTVAEAAKRLEVSEGAIRQRIHRDTIKHDRDDDGRVYVYLTPEDTEHDTVNDAVHDTVNYDLVQELRDRIRFLEADIEDRKEEARRKDSILMSLTQRIPELEAASEPRESSVSASEDETKGQVPSDMEKRSWWQRMFGG